MEHRCPTGKTQPPGFNPSSQSPNDQLVHLCEQNLGLCFMCSAVSVCKITESVCSGGFWIQPLKALNLPSGPLKRSLLSTEHQLHGTICRMRAEKFCVLVSEITSLPPPRCIRPKLLLRAQITSITVSWRWCWLCALLKQKSVVIFQI